ncbi:hypothetical protein [Escherichia coli]|uniref:hypothetical protein n=1 Tax=Escherichia coli TaxID=562 RepID=UPI001E30CBEE|nr:hypothetical protein [Escherichia coli]
MMTSQIMPRYVRLKLEKIQELYNVAVLDFESGDTASARMLFKVCQCYCCDLLNDDALYLDSYEIIKLTRLNALCLELIKKCDSVCN